MEALIGLLGVAVGSVCTYFIQKKTLERSLEHQSKEAALDRETTREVTLLRERLRIYTEHSPALIRLAIHHSEAPGQVSMGDSEALIAASMAICTLSSERVRNACADVMEQAQIAFVAGIKGQEFESRVGETANKLIIELQRECGLHPTETLSLLEQLALGSGEDPQ